jgi:hypothetical protein
MFGHQHALPPPAPAPPDHQVRRRYPSPSDRREGTREGRSRTHERQGQVRRFRSSDPGGSAHQGSVMTMNSKQDGTFAQGGFGQGSGRSKTSNRKMEVQTLLVREVEELRARMLQMEKTMRSVLT